MKRIAVLMDKNKFLVPFMILFDDFPVYLKLDEIKRLHLQIERAIEEYVYDN